MCAAKRVVYVKVQVDLLRTTVRPVGRQMVWDELDPDDPAIFGIEDIVEVIVGQHSTVEHASPERALCCEIAGIEDDHTSHHSHPDILARSLLSQTAPNACSSLPVRARSRVQNDGRGSVDSARSSTLRWRSSPPAAATSRD